MIFENEYECEIQNSNLTRNLISPLELVRYIEFIYDANFKYIKTNIYFNNNTTEAMKDILRRTPWKKIMEM